MLIEPSFKFKQELFVFNCSIFWTAKTEPSSSEGIHMLHYFTPAVRGIFSWCLSYLSEFAKILEGSYPTIESTERSHHVQPSSAQMKAIREARVSTGELSPKSIHILTWDISENAWKCPRGKSTTSAFLEFNSRTFCRTHVECIYIYIHMVHMGKYG